MFKKKKYLLVEDALDRFTSISLQIMKLEKRIKELEAGEIEENKPEKSTIPNPTDKYLNRDGVFSMKKYRGELEPRKDDE